MALVYAATSEVKTNSRKEVKVRTTLGIISAILIYEIFTNLYMSYKA